MKRLNLNEIQEREYNILCEFDKVCRENNLRYGLSGGTLLGAVRHKGFIPWDDDIDVVMPRPDYNKLINISDKVFSEYYKFVNPYSDNDTFHAYGKICDLRTSLIEFPNGKKIKSHLYIDIFPVDGMPNDRVKQEKHLLKVKRRTLMLYVFKIAKYKLNENLNPIKKLFWKTIALIEKVIPPKALARQVDRLAEKFSYGNTKYDAVIVAGYGDREIMPHQVYLFDGEIYFVNKLFKATSKSDYYLTNIYGNYMVLPPEDQRISHEMDVYEIE